jgi:hypothetical protein
VVLKLSIEEWPHAYLVVGTADYTIGRRALIKKLGRDKADKINRMPCRPMNATELGREPGSMVAFYFNIGPRCDLPSCGYCSTHEKDAYKP